MVDAGVARGAGFAVALEAADGEALLAGLVDTPVDVILSDIRMPGADWSR